VKKEIFPLALMLVALLPFGYYFAGSIVYNGVAYTNTDCWGNFDQNKPTQFAPLRGEVPLNESLSNENISEEIMNNLSAYWWDFFESATIENKQDNLQLSAWFHKQNVSAPWVIFVHGIRGCKADAALLLPSGMLANAGFNVVVFDLRDHGESSIDDDRVSGGQDEWSDVISVFDWLIEEHQAIPEKIGIFGNSMGAGTAAIAFTKDDRMQSVWLDSVYSDMGDIVVEELEFQGYPTFLGGAGIFAGKVIANQNLIQYYPLEAGTEIGERHMYIVHGNQDKRVRLHHSEKMLDEAMEHGNESKIDYWFEDSVMRYDIGEGVESDEHITLMLTHTSEYERRLIDFFTKSLN
tara:strand:- start:1058 stop:2107 length:1050 start_codon:yes stop_codon:yes gene_type:complete